MTMAVNLTSAGKYDPKRACPKCNNTQASSRFCPGKGFKRHVPGCNLDGEHIHRVCARCGYEWISTPLDAKE